MNLYIQISNNKPVDHPIMEENLLQAFPEIDILSLPSNFAKFERVELPEVGVYQIYEGCTYDWEDGIVKDVHIVKDMTADEILTLQNSVKEHWALEGFTSWVFNETTCGFEPPAPYPNDEKSYQWDEASISWIEQ